MLRPVNHRGKVRRLQSLLEIAIVVTPLIGNRDFWRLSGTRCARLASVPSSCQTPPTRTRRHVGRRKLRPRWRVHPSGPSCRIRVGEEWRCWEEGKVLLFDDSFEHEVENKTNELRVVLLIRFFHPALMEASEGARHVALQQASANQTAAERGRYECPP